MDERLIVWDVRQGTSLALSRPPPFRCSCLQPSCLRGAPGLAHHTLNAHSDPISAVDFNRDGTLLVSGSWDGLIRLWDSATGQCLKTLVHEVSVPLASIAFTPNAHHLLSTTLDSTSRLWTFQPAKVVKTFGLGGKLGNDRVGCGTVVLRRPRWPRVAAAAAGVGEGEGEGEGSPESSKQPLGKQQPDEVWLVGGTEEGRVVGWELQSRRRVLDLGKVHGGPSLLQLTTPVAHSTSITGTDSLSPDSLPLLLPLRRLDRFGRRAPEPANDRDGLGLDRLYHPGLHARPLLDSRARGGRSSGSGGGGGSGS
jgi:WD40 repeat protein